LRSTLIELQKEPYIGAYLKSSPTEPMARSALGRADKIIQGASMYEVLN
jgi:hypothetical protein